MAALVTPCLKICVMHPPSGLCLGCGRTMPEIVGWLRMTDAERLAVMATLPDRLATIPRGEQERAAG